ncbi:MAG: hypothetical protein LUH23_09195 [Oscillospiraceae bacterium]|nr:hypothetical protein [Oscillospiraceae bacterium]
MLHEQWQHYDECYILVEVENDDGEKELKEIKVSKAECFAPGEAPTEDNPYKQRWYYDPDKKIAVRLPRNEMGQKIYQGNACDLKPKERNTARQSECVGQHNKKMCPITCDTCPFKDSCTLPDRSNNSYGCEKKCEGCSVRVSRFRSMDKPIGKDDNGEPVFPDYDSSEDVETAYIRQEEDREYNEAVEELMRSFDKEEIRLLKCFKKMTIEEIAAELDLSVPTVIDRRNMYMEMFTMKWLTENQERQEMVKGLVNSLPEDEQILYFYMGKKLPDTEIAERLGIHRKTVHYRKDKLRRKFAARGLEEYFENPPRILFVQIF